MAISELLATLDAIKAQHPEAYEFIRKEGIAEGMKRAVEIITIMGRGGDYIAEIELALKESTNDKA